jgi:threonine dehydrogenase-like Zn-dependent dehydrogenase
VIAVDLSPARLELAAKVGADVTIRAGAGDVAARVREHTRGEGTVCAFEAVGNPAVLQTCLQVCAPGGRIVVMGAIVGKAALDLYSEFIFRELTLVASQQPRNPVVDSIYYHATGQRNRQTLLDLIRRGTINVRDLITHRYPYRDAPLVYRLLGEAKTADYDGRGDVHRDLVGVMFDWTSRGA